MACPRCGSENTRKGSRKFTKRLHARWEECQDCSHTFNYYEYNERSKNPDLRGKVVEDADGPECKLNETERNDDLAALKDVLTEKDKGEKVKI